MTTETIDQFGLMVQTPAEPPNGEYTYKEHGPAAGRQLIADFPNGYGASIITGPYSYGGDRGLYEIAVLHPEELCYSTPVTDDVMGYLSAEEVVEKLHDIAHLPRRDDCSHGHDWTVEE